MHPIDFRQVVEEADIGICITQDDCFQYVNPKFAQMHGWTAEQLTGHPLASVVHPGALARVNEIQRLRSLGRHHAPYQSRNVHRDGHVFDTRVFGRVISYRGRDANLTTIGDISELTHAQDRIERLVNYHPVTGLATRTLLLERAAGAVELAQRESRPAAMLFLHVAEVDRVHDALGLNAGDALATTLAARLLNGCRSEDTAAHLGNGDFAILLDPSIGADESQALNTATRLLASLAAPAAVDQAELITEGQIGIAMFPSDSSDAGELLAHAHAACGRFGSGISFFTRAACEAAARRIRLETALRRAFDRGEFELHYQPQVDLRSGAVIGAEALLRWRCEEFGAVSPAEFVPIAEEIGLIVPLGEWVFRSACRQSVAWQRAGLPPLRIGVNLSPRQLEEANISQRLQAILLDTGADPNRLGVEVTESMLMRDFDHARRTLQELSAIGVEIALDDFGTGYSNLGALRALPFDVLKIDRSLVHDVTAAPEDVSITRAVLMLAQGLKLKVLAEGVETEGQLNLLISNGCELMQGYIFSKPLPAAAFEQMLRDGERLPEHLLHRAGRARTLLLVDDDDGVLASLRRLLRGAGYRIVTARHAEDALARLAESEIDVIVSDQGMPGMSGVELMRRASALYPDTVRMILSGYSELQAITDAVNEGAIHQFLTKPWDDERLREHIAAAFRRKELADENRRLSNEVRGANLELARANQHQERMLAQQREQLSLEEVRALNAQDLLEHLPTAILGVDDRGMIAFVNRQARALMRSAPSLVGCDAATVLPADWLRTLRQADGRHHAGFVDGRPCLLSCGPMNDRGKQRGHLLSVIPMADACEEVAA